MDALHLGLEAIVMHDGHANGGWSKGADHRALGHRVCTQILMCIKDLSCVEPLNVHLLTLILNG